MGAELCMCIMTRQKIYYIWWCLETEYDLDEHVENHKPSICEDDKLSKFHILEQLNHMIYSDTISPDDYKIFEDIKNKLFNV